MRQVPKLQQVESVGALPTQTAAAHTAAAHTAADIHIASQARMLLVPDTLLQTVHQGEQHTLTALVRRMRQAAATVMGLSWS